MNVTFRRSPIRARFGLRAYLILFLLIAAVPSLVITIITAGQERQSRIDDAEAEVSSLTQLAAASQEQLIARVHQLLTTLATIPQVVNGEDGCDAFLSRMLLAQPIYTNFASVNSDGDVICSALESAAGANVSERLYFMRAVESGQFATGDYQIGRASGKQSLVFALPAFAPDGSTQAVLLAGLDLVVINEMLPTTRLPDGATLTMVDGNGTIVAHQPDPEQWIGQLEPNIPLGDSAFAGGEPGIIEATGNDGVERLYAFQALQGLPGGSLYIGIGIPKTVLYGTANAVLYSQIASLLTVVVLASVLASFGGQRWILKPVERLINAVRRVGEGDLSIRSDLQTGPRELRYLSSAFDDMTGTLHQRQQERAQALAELEKARDELEVRVRQRTADLEAANKELEAFSYSISHDLRAPLRAMSGFSRILIDEYSEALEPAAQRYLNLIKDNAAQMGMLIDDLLAFSRLSRQPLNRVPVDLNVVVQQVIASMQDDLKGRGIEFKVDYLPPSLADPTLLKQVYVNLLSNAVKFTRHCPSAVIHVGMTVNGDANGDQPVYFVRDNGTGFDMKYASKLFGVFQRLHKAEEFEGTGVGLAIVQRIIRRHGGQVWPEAAPNEGATFYFTLEESHRDNR